MLSGHIKQVWGAKPNFSLEPRGHLNPLSAMSPENFRAPYFSHRKSIENCVELKFGWCRVPLVIYSLCNFQLDWTSINGSNLHAKVQMVRNQQNGPAGRGLTSMNLKLWPQMLSDVNETHFPCKLCIFKSFFLCRIKKFSALLVGQTGPKCYHGLFSISVHFSYGRILACYINPLGQWPHQETQEQSQT